MKSPDLEQRTYLLALHRALNLTPTRFAKLRLFFADDWQRAWHADRAELQQAQLDARGLEKLFTRRRDVDPDQEWERLNRCGARMVVFGDDDYPVQLQHIASPPMLFFVRGAWSLDLFPSVSIVGSRRLSAYGKRAIDYLVPPLARAGITIVSGLAFGADTAAHRAAVEHGAQTICVLGNGIDEIYPTQNEAFAQQLLAENQGVILSEYLPGTVARPEYFPVRNRIVAGLSRATIIVEAAEKSGSLITAALALEQGKEVFAVPGEIFSKNSAGTNQLLLSSAAYPALSAPQIMQHLGLEKLSVQKQQSLTLPQTGLEADILRLFGTENRAHVNDLIRTSNLSGPELTSHLTIMEMKGLVRNLGSQIYAKNV